MVHVNPNISYASIASEKFKTESLLKFPPLLAKNYSFLSPYQHCFPFPYDVMKYILQNPKSPDQLLKLYQTCKYFFSKCPIVIISGDITFLKDDALRYDWYPKTFNTETKKIELWFINDLFISDGNLYKYKFSKIYRSSIKSFCIMDIVIKMDDFKLLVSENLVERFLFYDCAIEDINAKNASIDAVLNYLPNMKYLYFINENETFSSETLINLNLIKFKNKFLRIVFYFHTLTETFDPKLLFKFIQQNASHESCKIYLNCNGNKEIQTKLELAEKEIFYEENRSEMFEIHYSRPEGFQ